MQQNTRLPYDDPVCEEHVNENKTCVCILNLKMFTPPENHETCY